MNEIQQPTRKAWHMPFLHSLGVMLYVTLVALIMFNGNNLFGTKDTIFTIITVLLLFTISAAIIGSLIFGRPIMMALAGDKKGAIRFAVYTIGFLVCEATIFLIVVSFLQ